MRTAWDGIMREIPPWKYFVDDIIYIWVFSSLPQTLLLLGQLNYHCLSFSCMIMSLLLGKEKYPSTTF